MIEIVGVLLTLIWPLCITASVLRILKNGPDRALALPTPFMLLPVLRAQIDPAAPYYLVLASEVALVVLLYGCYQQKRHLARWAAIACGTAALFTQLSTTWLARS